MSLLPLAFCIQSKATNFFFSNPAEINSNDYRRNSRPSNHLRCLYRCDSVMEKNLKHHNIYKRPGTKHKFGTKIIERIRRAFWCLWPRAANSTQTDNYYLCVRRLRQGPRILLYIFYAGNDGHRFLQMWLNFYCFRLECCVSSFEILFCPEIRGEKSDRWLWGSLMSFDLFFLCLC